MPSDRLMLHFATVCVPLMAVVALPPPSPQFPHSTSQSRPSVISGSSKNSSSTATSARQKDCKTLDASKWGSMVPAGSHSTSKTFVRLSLAERNCIVRICIQTYHLSLCLGLGLHLHLSLLLLHIHRHVSQVYAHVRCIVDATERLCLADVAQDTETQSKLSLVTGVVVLDIVMMTFILCGTVTTTNCCITFTAKRCRRSVPGIAVLMSCTMKPGIEILRSCSCSRLNMRSFGRCSLALARAAPQTWCGCVSMMQTSHAT